MSEGAQNLAQQIQEQTLRSIQDFYGNSLGKLKVQQQGDRLQLESLAEQVPSEEAQVRIQEMVDSYVAIEESLDQAAQDLGVKDAVNQAVQQAQEALGQAAQGVQEAAGGAVGQTQDAVAGVAQQAQEAAGQVTDQARGAVGRVTGQAEQLAQGAQDTARQVAGQAQEAAGQVTQQAQEAVSPDGQEEPNATRAATQKAEQLGVDLSQVQGSGTGGRITIKDVTSAANRG